VAPRLAAITALVSNPLRSHEDDIGAQSREPPLKAQDITNHPFAADD